MLSFDALLLRSLRIGCMCCWRATAAAAALIGSHAGVYFAGERTVSLPLLLVASPRCAPCSNESRAALFACHAANNDKDTSDIVDIKHDEAEPSIWDVMVTAQKDRILLKLRVGESLTSKDKLELTTTEDQARLVVRYIGDNSPASELNVFELTIPPGYDGKKAQGWLLANGWLIITIAKPKNEARDAPEAAEEAPPNVPVS